MHQDIWAASRPAELTWRDWEEFGVVYDGASGSTHLLSALGIEILALLIAAPRREADVVSDLLGAMPDALDAEEARLQIVNQLGWLQGLGLISMGSPPA